ncbi:hypothetical protein ACTFIZ_008018 [Dictyostelium cf. discoideum]
MNSFNNILVTGGAGFVGSHLCIFLIKNYENTNIICIDNLEYCSNLKNLNEIINHKNFKFINGNILNKTLIDEIISNYKIGYIFHLAAQTHVENSFNQSELFFETNVMGTLTLLESSKKYLNQIKKFIHISTDEVYGENSNGSIEDNTLLNPTNPYSASKASSEHLVNCYRISFKVPTIITRSNNLFGEFQYPEKAIPKFITQLLNNEKITIQGNGGNLRSYLYIKEIINAYDIVLKNGKIGETYNVGTLNELSTIDLAKIIIDLFIKKESIIISKNDKISQNYYSYYIKYISDRPFNDKRYDVNFQKLKNLGWKTNISFEDSLEKTYDWIKSNKNHWNLKTNQ